MKKVFLVIIVLCLAVSAFFSWRITRPGIFAFPRSVNGIPRTSNPEYRNTESLPNVYAAIYGTDTVHIIQPLTSADEAKGRLQKFRESLVKQQQDFARGGTTDYVTFSRLNQPESGLLVYKYKDGDKWSVMWVNGNWYCGADVPGIASPGEEEEQYAQAAVDFAASLPYGPAGVTHSGRESFEEPFTLFQFVQRDLPMLLIYWLPVLIPASIAFIFLVILLISLVAGRRKQRAAASSPPSI